MNKEEIKAMQDFHYKKIRDMCWEYCDNEFSAKFTVIEKAINRLKSFEDKRLVAIDKLISNLIEERNRIMEIDKMGDSND